jgi:membrane-bound serine protease (ClpP class)
MKTLFSSSRFLRLFILLVVLGSLLAWAALPASAHEGEKHTSVVVLTSRGPITPVLLLYLDRGLRLAQINEPALVILELDTPGGSIDLMNWIVRDIRAAQVPVVVYVSPRNAMAGSAGTIITLAGHLAAMAPETSIGAASPVGPQGQDVAQTLAAKEKEMLKATVRNLTSQRPIQARQLAEDAIDNARAATVDEALQAGLVDIKAENLLDLIEQLDGREVLVTGETQILDLQEAEIIDLQNTLIESLLLLLVNPNVVFLLLAVGIQALLIELSSPGGWFAGFLGAVFLLLAFYGLGFLPVNWFGALFIVLALVLFIIETQTSTHGALSVAGAGSFVVGALVLLNSPPARASGFPQLSIPLVTLVGLLLAATFTGLAALAFRTQHQPKRVGRETLIGRSGWARSDIQPRGRALVAGEEWSVELVEGQDPIASGQEVEVVEVKGVRLFVKGKPDH